MKPKVLILLYLTLIVSAGTYAERQTIILTESGLPYESQVSFSGADVNSINDQISKYYDMEYAITSVSYTSNNWLVVMSTNSGLGSQTLQITSSWPRQWIREQWGDDYYITSLASNGSLWFVVMSQNPHFSGQVYNNDSWENLDSWIREKWAKNYDITETAFDGTYWMVVMSQTDYIGRQRCSLIPGNIQQKIQERAWDKEYSIQLLNYGGGHFFLVACQYLEKNDRQQSYCIRTSRYTDFIESEGNNSRMIAYAGGGIDRVNDNEKSSMSIIASRSGALPREKHLATLTWLNTESVTSQKNYTVNVGVKSDSKIEDVKLYVNGDLDRGISPVLDDGYDMKINRSLTLATGTNTIKLVVTNADGESVITREVVYKPQNNPSPLVKERRIALVMGNSDYSDSDKKLKNPVNDATDLSRKLEILGFTVIRAFDKTQRGMEAAINDFSNQVKDYDVALFYYAGHGMRCNGYNYLIPVDAVLTDESDVKYKCVNANSVLDKMDKSNCPMKIVILDACRNNPFTRGWSRGTEEEGLGIMSAPKGTFIAFSTAPGEVAQDGKGRNSPYTKALLQTLDTPNLSLMDFFQEVLIKVSDETNERQTPWTSNSFKGKFYFNKQ